MFGLGGVPFGNGFFAPLLISVRVFPAYRLKSKITSNLSAGPISVFFFDIERSRRYGDITGIVLMPALAEKLPTTVRLSMSVWNLIDGNNIVAGDFKHRRHDYEFAIDRSSMAAAG
jgi:hypothetical protein